VSLPTLTVEMDLSSLINGARLDDTASAQLDTAVLEYVTPTYPEDITAYVRRWDTERGASRELERVEAGTAAVQLDNRDGRFTPFLATSPYFPNIKPMRRVRVLATWSAVTYPVFMGFVEGWPITFPGDLDTLTTLRLVDGFKALSLVAVSGAFPQQGSGDRIAAILAAAGWPSTETDLDIGVVTVPAVTLDNVSALEHIQQIAHAEGGRFFMGRDGKAVFRNRTAQVNPDLSARTWADDGSGMSYRDATIVYDDSLILNDIRLTRPGGVEQVAADTASQSEYGIRSKAESDIQLVTDGDVASLGDELLIRYAQPAQRLERLVDNAMQHGLWDRVLDRELNDLALVIESRTATAQVSTIEGLAHSSDGQEWTVTLALSPSVIVQAGVLDDATYGLLDSTAILAR
jgi:hypothetical protein